MGRHDDKAAEKVTQNEKPEKALIVKVCEEVPTQISEEETEAPLCFKCDQCNFETAFEKGLNWMEVMIRG